MLLCATCAIVSCGHGQDGHSHTNLEAVEHEHEHDHDHDHAHDHDQANEGHGGEITLSPEMAAQAGVEVMTINPAPFRGAVRCSGKLVPASGNETAVAAKTSGIIRWNGGTPYPGSKVSAGQELASISASGMSEGDAASRNAIAYETAAREYERAKAMRAERIISEKEFNAAEAEFRNAANQYAGGEMGVSAPFNGYISQVLKSEGEYVQAGEQLAVVRNNDRIALTAEVPASLAGTVQSIDGVNFRADCSDSLFVLRGREGRPVGTASSLSSAYLPVSFEFSNPGGLLPGSFARIWLLTSEKDNTIAVPESALTEEQGEYFVYVRLDEDCYRKVRVVTGERNGQEVEIVSGLNGGEDVVVTGAFSVRVASSSNVIPGHTHNH